MEVLSIGVEKSQAATLVFSSPPSTNVVPRETFGISSGCFTRRNARSATSSIFQMTAVVFFTVLNRLAASVRSRAAANGDATGLVVRRCGHCTLVAATVIVARGRVMVHWLRMAR